LGNGFVINFEEMHKKSVVIIFAKCFYSRGFYIRVYSSMSEFGKDLISIQHWWLALKWRIWSIWYLQ